MLKASYQHHPLIFRKAAGTSRGILHQKDSWFIFLTDSDDQDRYGIGEVSIIPGLSIDPLPEIESELTLLCQEISKYPDWVEKRGSLFPAIRFGLETALSDFHSGSERIFRRTDFTAGKTGIAINGLIWMDDFAGMQKQIEEKIAAGFSCLKLKIGAIDFDQELRLLKSIRAHFTPEQIELRVDANGAFSAVEAPEKLKKLAEFAIHSIEQPIRQGQHKAMAALCKTSPIAIALDEELIGVHGTSKAHLLEEINPQYLILKPSLLGGLTMADEWIKLAEQHHINWWATSALESNIGLNCIAQWVFQKNPSLPQGLGTGQLYTNNIESPLKIERGKLFHDPTLEWDAILPQ